jgi:hypothetical protein
LQLPPLSDQSSHKKGLIAAGKPLPQLENSLQANIHLSIAFSDISKKITVSGVTCKIHPVPVPLKKPSAPQGLIHFIQRPPRAMIGGQKGDAVLFLPNYFQFDLQFYFHFTSDPNLVLELKAGFVYLKCRRYWSAEGCF